MKHPAPRQGGGKRRDGGGPSRGPARPDRRERPNRPHFERPSGTGPVSIVYEDADLVVVDKPPGLLSARLPDEERESLFDAVKEHVRAGSKRPVRVWIVHRLDKDASGLLVFAKSEKAFNWLKEDLRAKRMRRMYMAVVEGEIGGEGEQDKKNPEAATPRFKQAASGTIQSFIRDDEFGNAKTVGIGEMARASSQAGRGQRGGRDSGGGHMGPQDADAPRLAVTHWRVIGAGQGRTLLQLKLETGRKNQIRVHMQEFKHPIIGDARYGAATNPISRLALHASELAFTHPGTGQPVRYVSQPPASFYRVVGMEPVKAGPEPEMPTPTSSAVPPAPRVDPAAPSRPEKALPHARGNESEVSTSWDSVAGWYDRLIEDDRSDHFRHVIVPGALRLLRPDPSASPMRVLDIACGQGAFCRKLAEMGVEAVGVDASKKLIDAARKHNAAHKNVKFEVGDARFLPQLNLAGPFDAATSIMALMNIDPLEPVLRGAAGLVRAGGAFVAVILHPAFRTPVQTSWGWDERPADARPPRGERETRGAGPRRSVKQYRRVDGYLSPGQMPITMNPGHAARGAEPVQTWTFHRPIQTYVRVLAEAGFLVEAIEEWPSMRRSQPGPRAAEEDRARREIPMFLGIRAIKRG